jgi:uncharacterized membrane protein YhaH (DUF805 family)
MTFQESIRTAFRKYAEFTGRATRPEFWWFFLFVALGEGVCNVFSGIPVTSGVTLGAILGNLFALAILLPFLAVGVRRLRDTGREWGHIFWLLLPLAGLIILAIFWSAPSAAVAETNGSPLPPAP